ncbi:MAG: alpha/beta hydrolase [Bacillota bacterium]
MSPGILIFLTLLAATVTWIYQAGPRLPAETDAIIDEVLRGDLPDLVIGETGVVSSSGLDIWYESISPVGSPRATILLIMGVGGSALEWPQGFVRAFVCSGYHVIRYDQRGTGLSDRVEDWDRRSPYTIADMAGDALAVLDGLGVETAHIIGFSMGGMIAQEIAIRHPERVKSLTLMMTSGHVGDPDLPGPSSRYFISSLVKGIPILRYRVAGGERNLIKERIAKMTAAVGYEQLDIREIAEMVLFDLRERTGISISAALQHQKAVSISGSRYEQLKTLDVPALIVHGTQDELLPVEHGRKLARVLPKATGLWLEDTGHVFPPADVDALVRRIIAHLRAGE